MVPVTEGLEVASMGTPEHRSVRPYRRAQSGWSLEPVPALQRAAWFWGGGVTEE